MDNIVLSLSVGLILGILIASGVWAVLLALVRSERKNVRERNAVMRGITEECAEAEKIISSPAAKTMDAPGLRSALSPKVEKIRRTLMTNMHILDIYFVKYVESLADAYQRMYSETGAQEALPSAARADVPEVSPAPPAVDLLEKQKVPIKEEEEFNLEKEITSTVEKKIREEARRPVPETKPAATEKTIQWDRNELLGLASRPEAIVVEGIEEAKPAAAGQKKTGAETAPSPSPSKKEEKKPEGSKEDMVSGEDIVNKLDSFFGFNG